jgi:hypothetical protein
VLRGQARLLAAAATRQRAFTLMDLARADRDPQAYLQTLEERLLQSTLLSRKKQKKATDRPC